MAGVDPRTVQTLGGWRTFAMVQRYSHRAPDHLQAAVGRLVPGGVSQQAARAGDVPAALQLERDLNVARAMGVGVA